MTFHRANPANFVGEGGESYDRAAFSEAVIRSELVELIAQFCFEHSAKAADKILEEYKVAPRRGHKYS